MNETLTRICLSPFSAVRHIRLPASWSAFGIISLTRLVYSEKEASSSAEQDERSLALSSSTQLLRGYDLAQCSFEIHLDRKLKIAVQYEDGGLRFSTSDLPSALHQSQTPHFFFVWQPALLSWCFRKPDECR